jgi:hypothetical protein
MDISGLNFDELVFQAQLSLHLNLYDGTNNNFLKDRTNGLLIFTSFRHAAVLSENADRPQ